MTRSKLIISSVVGVVIILLIAGSHHDQSPSVNQDNEEIDFLHPANYFPRRVDQFRQKWYGEQLMELGEKRIWRQVPSDKFTFRFIWLRTFHHPICVRLEHNDDGRTMLYGKELNGAGGYKPGKLIVDSAQEISDEEYKKLRAKIDSLQFYQLPTELKDDLGADGAQWIFESNDKGRYHVIDRWCAQGEIQNLGIALLSAAKLLPADHIY